MTRRRRPVLLLGLSVAALALAAVGAAPAGSVTGRAKSPNGAQKKLIASVPSTIRSSCGPAKPIPKSGSTAAIVCNDGSGSTLEFDQFKKVKALNDWYDGEVSTFNVTGTTAHTPGQCPFDNQWSALGKHRGRVLCLHEGDGSAWYEWTDEATLIFATAIRKDGDAGQLDSYWQRAGPCVAKDKACLNL